MQVRTFPYKSNAKCKLSVNYMAKSREWGGC